MLRITLEIVPMLSTIVYVQQRWELAQNIVVSTANPIKKKSQLKTASFKNVCVFNENSKFSIDLETSLK